MRRNGLAWYLRVYIDKETTGVSIDDCEAVSRTLSDLLDRRFPIQDAYTFRVSSPPRADRALKKPEHFAAFLGEQVDAKFYQPVNGQKAVTGTLVGYDNGDVTLDLGDGPVTFAKKDVAQGPPARWFLPYRKRTPVQSLVCALCAVPYH